MWDGDSLAQINKISKTLAIKMQENRRRNLKNTPETDNQIWSNIDMNKFTSLFCF